jgi:chlorobactene glucosyltransferase
MSGRWRRVGLPLLLWSYVACVVAFYAVLYRRTLGGIKGAYAVASEPAATPASQLAGRPETAPTQAGQWPLVSIIVPARDEERNIRGCVESLLEQDYPNFEVLVVDDGSTDATPELLRAIQHQHPQGARLEVLRVETLPEGWAGKPHALHTGAVMADGQWLLFTDADTRHRPQALRFAVTSAEERGVDLLSLTTTQDVPDFWGRVLMPMAYLGISMQYPLEQVNDPSSAVAIANGQYILLNAAMYKRIGGYASSRLRATVLDDRDLAREVKRVHGRPELVDGRSLVHTRMYHNLREHWNGWSKNAYAGSRGGPLFYLLMIAGLPLLCIVPFALLLFGLVSRRRRWIVTGGIPVAATIAYRTRLNREVHVPWRYIWTHPLAAAVFTGILAHSLWRKWSGRGVQWKSRTIRV